MNTSIDNNRNTIYTESDYDHRINSKTNETKLTTGPGGTSIVVENDSLIGAPPSEEGVQKLNIVDLRTYDPTLPEAQYDLYNGLDAKFSQSLLEYLSVFLGMDENSSIGSLLQKENTTDLNEELSFIRNAADEYEMDESNPTDPFLQQPSSTNKSSIEQDPFTSYLQNLMDSVHEKKSMSPENEKLFNQFSSTDPQEVTNSLIQQSGIEERKDLDPQTLLLLKNEMGKLGELISNANKSGDNSILHVAIPELLYLSFATSLGLNGETALNEMQKEALSDGLYAAAKKLSSASFEKTALRPAPDPAYTKLTSGDQEAAQEVIQSFLQGVDLSGLTEEEQKALASLGQKISNQSIDPNLKTKLLSNNPEIVQEALTSLIGDSFENGIPALFIQNIMAPIAAGIGKLNGVELQNMLKSGSQEDIELALGILSETTTSSTLEPQAKKVVGDYLKVLTDVLVFMAQIRSLITQLEGAFTQAVAAAKNATISEQIKNSMDLYLVKVQEIEKKYVENAKKIKKAAILKVLMPLISILLLIVAIVMIVVSLVGAVATGGASLVGLALVAKIISLVVALAVTSAVLIYTTVDAISSWSTGKGILERAFANEPESKKSALIMIVNLAITIGTAVLTFGVAIGSAIAMSAVQGISASLRSTLQAAMQLIKSCLKQLFSGAIGAQIIGLFMGALFSSGYMQNLLVKLFKAMHASDQAAAMLAMVTMIVVSIAIIGATGGTSALGSIASFTKSALDGAGRAAASVANGVASLGKGVIKTVNDIINNGFLTVTKNVLQKIKDIISKFAAAMKQKLQDLLDLKNFLKGTGASSGIASTSQAGAQAAMDANMTIMQRMLKRFLEYMRNNLLMPAHALEYITTLLQVIGQAITADTARIRADINTSLAALERESSAIEAVAAFLQSTGTVGSKSTMTMISDASKEMFEDWKALCTMVGRFITDMSIQTTELHKKVN